MNGPHHPVCTLMLPPVSSPLDPVVNVWVVNKTLRRLLPFPYTRKLSIMDSHVRRAERRENPGGESRGSEGRTCVWGQGCGRARGQGGPSFSWTLGGRWLLPPLWASCSATPGLSHQGGPDLRVALRTWTDELVGLGGGER